MSYDVSIQVAAGPDVEVEAFWRNYTSNTSRMWTHALGRSLREFDKAPASEAAGPLAVGVRKMEYDPVFYRQWEPDNGWGDYDGALAFLRAVAGACAAMPLGVLRVSA